MSVAEQAILKNSPSDLWTYLGLAAHEFNIIVENKPTKKVGIVGEIYLKFHPFAQKDLTSWLVSQDIEVVPPLLTDFFMQSFVNAKSNVNKGLRKRPAPKFVMRFIYRQVWKYFARANKICQPFAFFTPFESIFSKAEEAERIITLNAQFGEGWLLPGEVLSMARQGITHVISLQPFGCIANHIVSKGLEKKMKSLYPGLDILSLDFDSGVSDANIRNRLLLFINEICQK